MHTQSADNKKIARNTLLLYFRMFITMAVGLYTSRVVLNILGVVDYGIYNVVGGIITMMSFLNVAMVQSSQRYISFELGRGDSENLIKVFSTSINIHLAISVLSVLMGETIGLWFINTQLNIPTDRMLAANCVYQASIVTFVVNVMSVPYNATIVAHEKMSAFAYISILEVSLKLAIVYALLLIPLDRLIIYSVLTVAVGVCIRLCYTIYCRRHFSECKYHFVKDKKIFKEMFTFAGWSVLGNLGLSFKDQLSNVILNIFSGPAVNAARGIGMHVNSMVNTFATNFTMALNPQITKQYAVGDIEASKQLVFLGSRFSFFLLTLISVPILVHKDYILILWLGIVPEYTSQFLTLSIITSLLYATSSCVTTAIQATGKLKWFQIGVCVIMLSEIPIAWLLLNLGYPPYSVMWPTIISYSIAVIFRILILIHYVPSYNFFKYVKSVLLRCLIVFSLSYMTCKYVCNLFQINFSTFVLTTILNLIIISFYVFFVGMIKNERNKILNVLYKRISKSFFIF